MVIQLSEGEKVPTSYSEHGEVYRQKLSAKALKQESINPEQSLHRSRN